MDTNTGSKPQPPPGTTADAEAVALQAQVLDHGALKDVAAETSEVKVDSVEARKKAPSAGFANYFVCDLMEVTNEMLIKTHSGCSSTERNSTTF
jgi:hypothetical protein